MTKVLLPEINVGLVGHVDHGKTTLTSALSGRWTDTHSEELKRGITIKLGYADIEIRKTNSGMYTTKKKDEKGKETKLIRKISLVDSPGHETLMAVMISGAAIMDGAILLIAANEPCPQPQTSEHLAALKVLGIKNIVVVQNKIDLVSKTEAKNNYEKIKKFVKKALDIDVPVIPISAQKQVNIDLLLQAIDILFKVPDKRIKGDPELMVARSFDINKPGTKLDKLTGGVLGGAIVSGEFKVGDKIETLPGIKQDGKDNWLPIKSTITAIVSGNTKVNKKGPGGSVAISTNLDPAVSSSDALVGNIVGLVGKTPPLWYNLTINLNLFDTVIGMKGTHQIESIKINEPLMINSGTATTLGVVNQIGKTIKLNLRRPICAHKGSKVAVSRRIGNRWHLIGFGVIQ